ncbi:MAG: ABC transporter ATP-binding protein [Chitinophagales bacterium]|nr:ABC transporter ATP-binding protein [Chitinophagales bacterium]
MIRTENLEKSFGKLHVLKGVSTSFEAGQVVSVIGPNGSGKTTLIKCILGMVVADKGSIFFDGKNIGRDFQYRNNIGYMPQIGRYPANMKIGQLFSMMKDLRKAVTNTDNELIKEYALEAMFDKPMHTLSGGTTQKVSAALAFLFNPKVLILDEPTAGLDPLASEILKAKILKAKEEGRLVIITSHIMSEVEEMADKILYLFEGSINFYKTVSELKTETGEERLGKAIAKIMKERMHV